MIRATCTLPHLSVTEGWHPSLRTARTETEKDILTVVVPNDRQEEIFEFIYECAEIGRPHGGIIYQTNLSAATAYSLPDLPDEA